MDMTKKMVIPVLLVIALILQTVSIGTNEWMVTSKEGNGVTLTAKMGLWKACAGGSKDDKSADVCTDLPNPDWTDKTKTEIDAIRGLMITSVALIPVFIALSYFKPEMKLLNCSVLALSVIAGIVAAGLWVNNDDLVDTSNRVKSLGYSYWLNVAGYFVTLIALVMFAWQSRSNQVRSQFGFRFY
jgi:hypothetical protein